MKPKHERAALAAALLLTAAAGLAQDGPPPQQPASPPPIFKCGATNGPTYTHVPCAGGSQVAPAQARRSDRHAAPPQDRARLARRAQLAPDARNECEALDARLREQDAFVRARGNAVTADEERPLIQGKLRYRELRC